MKQWRGREALRRVARVARAARRRWAASAALAACAVAALAAAARLLAPPTALHVADFPAVRPADLAHLLADISANTHPIPGSWSLEEEAGNYTWWRYAVSYSCGARCAGRVAVSAHAAGAPRHGAADRHRVTVLHTQCSTLPLLPWPQLCDEVETESVVSAAGGGGGGGVGGGGGGGGSRLQETARARCSAAAALLGACSSAGELRARAAARTARLRHLLHAPAPHPSA